MKNSFSELMRKVYQNYKETGQIIFFLKLLQKPILCHIFLRYLSLPPSLLCSNIKEVQAAQQVLQIKFKKHTILTAF